MRSLIATLLITLAAGAGAAPQNSDPLKSPACLQALTALQQQETEAAAIPRLGRASGAASMTGSQVEREALRRVAAQTCLGGQADSPPAQRSVPQSRNAVPMAAPPSISLPSSPQRAAPAMPLPPIQIQIPTPRTVTACDAAGCWASDGTRLQRAGPSNLIGPSGLCTAPGSVLDCP